MYIVACKWISDGVSEYKLPSEYLESSTSSAEEIMWAVTAFEFASIVRGSSYYVDYVMIPDPNGKDKITLTYYTNKEGYDTIKTKPEYSDFLAKRQDFLNSTGLTLAEKEAIVGDTSLVTNPDFDLANQYFS